MGKQTGELTVSNDNLGPVRGADFRRDDYDSADPPAAAPPPPERATRALATARFDAFVSSGVTKPEACDRPMDGAFDFDRCVVDDIANPVLFSRQTGDPDEVNRADVQQNQMGDCSLFATLAALASTPEGRATIKSAIVENKSDRGEVTSYTVTLYKRESHWLGLRPATFSAFKVTVGGLYVQGHARPRAAAAGHFEVWPLIIEKAYAQFSGGYNKIAPGGAVRDAMETITGRPAAKIRLGWLQGYDVERLRGDLAAGKLVVLETEKHFDGGAQYKLVPDHAYQVTGTELKDGKVQLRLHNPWNHSEPEPVPFEALAKWFKAVDVGSVR
jgi:hypothetical protein